MTQIPTSIMTRLKNETSALHQLTEQHDFQRTLSLGEMPLFGYIDYLRQMLLVHEALEDRLRAGRDRTPALRSVVHDYVFKVPHLESDLGFFEASAAELLPGTRRVISQFHDAARSDETRLLGYLYVLEGSTNGGKYIARGLRKAYGLEPGPGLSYFDPYGDKQAERWQAFKRDMDAVTFTPSQADAIVEGAKQMFDGFMAISTDLWTTMEKRAEPATAGTAF